MSDEVSSTPSKGPGEQSSTPEGGPDSSSGATSASQTPSPSAEELQELRRLRENKAGWAKEVEKERAERQRVERELQAMRTQVPQYQPAPQPPQVEPEFRVLAKRIQKAVYDGEEEEIAHVLADVAARPTNQMVQLLSQAAVQTTKQQAFDRYLQDMNVNPGTNLYKQAQKRFEEAKNDPKYSFVADNPIALSAIIVNELKVESATARKTAEETARDAAVEGGATEGTRGGGLPGKKPEPVEKMYFDEGDMKMIRHAMRADGITEDEARKRRWAHMDARTKAARVEAGKAV